MKGYGEYHRDKWLKCHKKIQDVLMAAVTGTYMGSLEEKTGFSRRRINKHLRYFVKKEEVVRFGRKIYWKPNYQGYEIYSRMPSKILTKLEKLGVNSFEFACSNILMFFPRKKAGRIEMNMIFCQIDEGILDATVKYLKEELGFIRRKGR